MSLQTSMITKLQSEYSGGVLYGGQSCVVHARESIKNNGFMGSENIVFLTSRDSITHEAPGCIAADLVNMVAKNVISLGMAGRGTQPVPFRIYSPKTITMTAKHLSVGDIMFLVVPDHGSISCNKLTLSKSTEEEPDSFELIKSWAINDEMEVEIIPPLS